MDEAGYQALRLDRPDLFFREVDHADHLAAGEIIGLVQVGDLGAGFEYTDFGPEIYLQDVCGNPSLFEDLCRENSAHAQLDALEVCEGDHFHVCVLELSNN